MVQNIEFSTEFSTEFRGTATTSSDFSTEFSTEFSGRTLTTQAASGRNFSTSTTTAPNPAATLQ